MRLSVLPSIILLIAALAFMFAFMASGVIFLPTFFNLIGVAALVWLAIVSFSALVRLGRAHSRARQLPPVQNKAIRHTERRA